MSSSLGVFPFFLPTAAGTPGKVIEKNNCYFNFIFNGGNYYTKGNILQRIFGGRDNVSLIAGLRLEGDGSTIKETQDPNVVLDKRTIQVGKTTNIPLVLNLLTKIPAYMNQIGFTFKIATLKRTDNFSSALDVLNDNKSTIDSFVPGVVGKALGIGQVVKDLFTRIDEANNHDMLESTTQDFIVTADATVVGSNTLQEGFLVFMVQGENEVPSSDDGDGTEEAALIADHLENVRSLPTNNQVFLKLPTPRPRLITNTALAPVPLTGTAVPFDVSTLEYDEANKVLKSQGKVVTNTYLVFKVERVDKRGEDTTASWSDKLNGAVNVLKNETNKTLQQLQNLTPQFQQLLSEGSALLTDDHSFIQSEKDSIRDSYIAKINAEIAKFH